MSNALTKAAVRRNDLRDPSLLTAMKNGGPMVWLSCLVMGLGNILNGQIIKGLLFLAVEIGVFVYLFSNGGGLYWISMLPSGKCRRSGTMIRVLTSTSWATSPS